MASHMPTHGCEHLNDDMVAKIQAARKAAVFDPDFVQYTCIACPTTGGFPLLNGHFDDTKHTFAISPKAVYCMACKDIVYDPNITFRANNGRKRKIFTRTKEDEEYIAANTLTTPCGRSGVRGLFNLGETCYMNAILQMMVHNRILHSYFCGMGHPLYTCPISKEPDKKNDSEDSDDEANGGAAGEEKDQKTCVACGMTELFQDTSIVDQTVPAHAVNLLFASWKNISHMSGKSQQDAQEWFTIIVDKLHEVAINEAVLTANSHSNTFKTLNRATEIVAANGTKKSGPPDHCPCFFHDVFYGWFESKITCDTCREGKSDYKEEFSSLSLDFRKQNKRKKKEASGGATGKGDTDKSSSKDKDKDKSTSADAAKQGLSRIGLIAPTPSVPTLFECLRSYTAPENLSAESYHCPKCKTSRSATKTLKIHKLPVILAVHVKRFGMRKVNGVPSGVSEKYEGKLDFPLSLDMGPYTTAGPEDIEWGGKFRGKYMYDLDCVVVHQGEHSHTGHYYAFCRVGGRTMGRKSGSAASTLPGGRWYKFDDEIVSATTVEDVLRQDAYLLFYGLRDLFNDGDPSTDA